MEPADGQLMYVLQQGLPLERRPFARIGKPLGLTEAEVIARTKGFFERGLARRLGGVFDSRHLGYDSTLVAATLPAGRLAELADKVGRRTSITHSYQREATPNFWFTVTARQDLMAAEMELIQSWLECETFLVLPSQRTFKVQVILNTTGKEENPAAVPAPPRDLQPRVTDPGLSEPERAVVRQLQENIPLTPCPFDEIAKSAGYPAGELVPLLKDWQARGILRRVGLVLYHQRAGFAANGMCVWPVPEAEIVAAGGKLARQALVTHCYQRPASSAFPYNLFAMIHCPDRDAARQAFAELSRAAGISGGKILFSTREFKKTSPRFFCEAGAGP